mmetsp:Transcript_6889/g.21523  ORF Transcript_6889/g.21523 Transcript_6889/m.21523 type:complete len:212 (+) Transcript_6889:299-934(+)
MPITAWARALIRRLQDFCVFFHSSSVSSFFIANSFASFCIRLMMPSEWNLYPASLGSTLAPSCRNAAAVFQTGPSSRSFMACAKSKLSFTAFLISSSFGASGASGALASGAALDAFSCRMASAKAFRARVWSASFTVYFCSSALQLASASFMSVVSSASLAARPFRPVFAVAMSAAISSMSAAKPSIVSCFCMMPSANPSVLALQKQEYSA